MGSTQSTSSLQDYQIHRRCLNHNIVTKKSQNGENQTFFLKTFNTPDRELHESQLNFFKTYFKKMKQNQELTSLLQVFEEKNQSFCSSSFKTHLLYEYSPITINSEIIQRRRPQHTLGKSVNPTEKSQFFKYDDLCNILYSCLSALWQIKQQSLDSPILELQRFKTIFITTKDILILEDGSIKITDPFLYNYEHRYTFNSNLCYAPQKISDFYLTDDQKCSIYELGITMLQVALLTEVKNTEKGSYDQSKILQKIQLGRRLYRDDVQDSIGVTFFDIVERMVQTDREKRYSLNKIIEYAQEMYEQEIQETEKEIFQQEPHESHKKGENNRTNHSSNAHTRSPSLNKFKQFCDDHKIAMMSPKISNFIIEQVQAQKQQQSSMLSSLNVHNPPSKFHNFNSSITDQGIFKNVTLNDSYTYQIGKTHFSKNTKIENKQNEQEQLFTDPELLNTIRRELQEIQRRKDEKNRKSYGMKKSLVVEKKPRYEVRLQEQSNRAKINNGVYLTQ